MSVCLLQLCIPDPEAGTMLFYEGVCYVLKTIYRLALSDDRITNTVRRRDAKSANVLFLNLFPEIQC